MTSNGTEAIWKSLQGTPQQMGITYAIGVFANQNLTPGASVALQNPPFRFIVGNQVALLPPPNTVIGGPIPYIPDGLTVVWAPSFMGLPIPSDMISPLGAGGKLIIDPLEILSAGGSGNQTNAKLVANNKVLLNLLMSVTGAIVNSYSSNPYANPSLNKGAYGTLSSYLLDYRNKVDFLIPNQEKRTFLGGIAHGVIPIYENVVEPIIDLAANVVVPGSGVALAAAQKGLLNPALNKATANSDTTNKIGANLFTTLVPQSVASSPIVSELTTGNNWIYVLIGIIVLIIIIWLILRK